MMSGISSRDENHPGRSEKAPVEDRAEQLTPVALEINEAEESELTGKCVKSESEAYDLYNDYAFKIGFGTRKEKTRYRVDGTVASKQLCCSKSGKKDLKKRQNRAYSKMDTRTGCKAKILFEVNVNGDWIVKKHDMQHNHPFCDQDKVHLLRSHRKVSDEQLEHVRRMKDSGVKIADAIRFLEQESGGSPVIGFTNKDMYDALKQDRKNSFSVCDSNTLIELLERRQADEFDFYFDMEIDDENRWCSFFWRDAKMRDDYRLFGDLVVHDITYCPNKYNIKCVSLVGMNNHCMNVMFGCGFLLHERVESFVWLFQTFLRSMDPVPPKTIMTDQCPAMSTAIEKVFPTTKHRLCIWHIIEDSKKHIKTLRSKEGFVDNFNYLLKYTELESEFTQLWKRLLEDYQCLQNPWLKRLHSLRYQWCRAFSKDYFSAGVLSLQRNETTYHAISRKVNRISGLCDFYHGFNMVVSEWRADEKKEDLICSVGKKDMIVTNVKMLSDARDAYSTQIYTLFEEEYTKSWSCQQDLLGMNEEVCTYNVRRHSIDNIQNIVKFSKSTCDVSCTCKMMQEVGILCCHCMRIMNINCIDHLPKKYILQRWTKNIIRFEDKGASSSQDKAYVSCAVWKMQMKRKIDEILNVSQSNKAARSLCEETFQRIKELVEKEVGPISEEPANEH